MAVAEEREEELRVLERIREGDERAFEELFREYYGPLCSFSRSFVGSDEKAEEIVQDLFVRLWDDRREWDVSRSVKAYLYRSVRNRSLNAIRGRKRRERMRDTVARDVPRVAAPEDTEERLDTERLTARVHEAIEQLPERCRLAMKLRWNEEMKYTEIADVMGISVKGVENQLSRGLKALQLMLDQS